MTTKNATIPLIPALLVTLAALFFPAHSVHAQKKNDPVTWSASVSRPTVRAGESVAVRVKATIAPGYHIYSTVPVKAESAPFPTEITVKATGLTVVGKPVEPKPKLVDDKNFNATVGMHEGTPTFTQVLSAPKTAKPGRIAVTASVVFMACTDTSCLPPKMVKVAVPAVTIEKGVARKEFLTGAGAGSTGAEANLAGAETTRTGLDGNNTGLETTRTGAEGNLAGLETTRNGAGASNTGAEATRTGDSGDAGLGAFLATAFGAGLVALVTPCVFPLIPVTLAFFTKRVASENPTPNTRERGNPAQNPTPNTSGVVKLAALYCLGIVLAFTAIGAVLAATVGAAGANRLAANPWVNLGFGVLFIVFALSLLEVIELKPPTFLAKLTNTGAQNDTGAGGIVVMGLTFVLAAFTCTAPFIGTVLVAAASAQTGSQWVRPILGMTTFALALALPFFLLALFPSWLAKLPKSGAWLSTVKGAMGWIELVAAVKFLSSADQVFGWQLLNGATMLALWAMIFVAGGFWLLGVLRVGWGAPDAPATPVRAGFAALFFALGAYCVYGVTGRPLDSFTVAYLPATDYGIGAKSEELSYHDTLEAGLAEAKATGKPVFVDFTGYTCTNCRWMERNVFPQAPVESELKNFVRVRLYTDNRVNGAELQAYQEKTFGTVELPLYAVLDSDGKPVGKPVGKTDSPDAFASFLRGGRETVVAFRGSSTLR